MPVPTRINRRSTSMTGRQKAVLYAATLVVALTRLFAISRTLWDWDETLFGLGVEDFNIAFHHPQPPGFPLFIFLAKLAHLFVPSNFGAVQTVTVAFSLFVFPACYFAARSFDFSFEAGIAAGLLLSFLPNVWFFGGTGFSDVPALVLELVAVGALLRGVRDRRWFFLGSFFLALTIGIRIQTVMIGLLPFLLAFVASTRRRWRDAWLGLLLVAVTVSVIYGLAVVATGPWQDYLNAFRAHQAYVLNVDSFHNPVRAPVRKLVAPLLCYPFGDRGTGGVVAVLLSLSLFQFSWSHIRKLLLVVLTFGPFFVFALFMLDPGSISRLSIGYMPLLALLGAGGIETVALLVARLATLPVATGFRMIAVAYFVTRASGWTLPSLAIVRRTASPPAAAVEWIRAHRSPGSVVLVDEVTMLPFAQLLLSDYAVRQVGADIAPDTMTVESVYITEGAGPANSIVFRRGGKRLRKLARERYFEASVLPVVELIQFGRGWYGPEEEGQRWMAASGDIVLPPTETDRLLRLELEIPADAFRTPPQISMALDGRVETFEARDRFLTRLVEVPAGGNGHRLTLSTTETANPAKLHRGNDSRELGLRVLSIGYLKVH